MEKLTLWEQETIINFNRDESWAEIYTHDQPLIRRLDKLCCEFPDILQHTDTNAHGGKSYNCPKELITVRKPVSDKRRSAMREQALKRGAKPPSRMG